MADASLPSPAADAANHEGGVHFAARRYDLAAAAYTRAIDLSPTTLCAAAPRFYANRAAARLRLEQPELAAHDAALALAAQPDLWKAALRLALALERLGRREEAAAGALRLLSSAAPLPAAASCEAAALLRRTADTPPAEPSARALVREGQTLRLHLALRAELSACGWVACAVRLSNEMGLFDAAAFEGASGAAVRLTPLLAGAGGGGRARLLVRQAVDGRVHCDSDGKVWLRRGAAVAELRLDGVRREAARREGAGREGTRVGVWARVPLDARVLSVATLPAPLLEAEEGEGVASERGGCEGGGTEKAEAQAVQAAVGGLLAACGDGEALQCVRVVQGITAATACLVVAESAAGICGRVWDSALVLHRWVERTPLDGAVALELGSGTGLGGLAAARRGARVVLSDLEEACWLLQAWAATERTDATPRPLPLIRRVPRQVNAAANAPSCAWPPRVLPLSWGEDTIDWPRLLDLLDGEGALEPAQRLVLCSDVVYDPSAYEPLLVTLLQLTETDGSNATAAPRIIMAHRSRHPDEAQFWDAAAARFHICVLEGPRFRPLGSAFEFDSIEEGSSSLHLDDTSTIRLLELKLREAL
ncbi:hypothetical protein AB1Y20_009164 [Prymnesium parvum]|uniref:Calmodulin-lysine N-methyltransferase n=1 Tax=Prymnesium parvum TaxID=97485 RepID=A0AB34K1D8_PRYPA